MSFIFTNINNAQIKSFWNFIHNALNFIREMSKYVIKIVMVVNICSLNN